MATIKVFSAEGVKELQCFDTLLNVPYLVDEDLCEPESELEEIPDDQE